MNKCVNIKSPEFIELVRQSGLHPAILSAKMGVWMEKNDTDEWPSLEQLDITSSSINYDHEIDVIFKNNPELNNIGNKVEYINYLKSIFPNSIIKDILYHGTIFKIEEFKKNKLGKNTKAQSSYKGFFFTDNKKVARSYIKKERISEQYYLHINNENLLQRLGELNKDDIDNHIDILINLLSLSNSLGLKDGKNYYDDSNYIYTIKDKISLPIYNEENEIIDSEEILIDRYFNHHYEYSVNSYIDSEISEKEVRDKMSKYDYISNRHTDTINLYLDKLYYIKNLLDENIKLPNLPIGLEKFIDPIKYSNTYHHNSILNYVTDKYFTDKIISFNEPNPNITRVLINIQNPISFDYEGKKYREITYDSLLKKGISNKNDGAIFRNTYDSGFLKEDEYLANVYVSFNTDDIHILGSKQDIEEFKKFVEIKSERESGLHPAILSAKMGVYMQDHNTDEWPSLEQLGLSSSSVNYNLRIIDSLLKLQRNKFESSKLQGWINDLQKQGVPKEQIEFFKESAKDGMTKEEILSSILANYSYGIEVNTATNKSLVDEDTGQEFINKNEGLPTQHYSNLTVPGGTNYTENEISTPLITPSIKGHAQFSTDQGIGWFRSDERSLKKGSISFEEWYKENKQRYSDTPFDVIKDIYEEEVNNVYPSKYTSTKTRRILEIQSDLFQKGRDKEILTGGLQEPVWVANPELEEGGSYEYPSLNEIKFDETKNQFLQLLNKDNNWVTFFIKSIIQDSAKKGYEKVLFPKGETAAKVEGHQTIAGELSSINDNIDKLKKVNYGITSGQNEELGGYDAVFTTKEEAYRYLEDYNLDLSVEKIDNSDKIEELEKRKSELKSQGIEKLKPIEAFYEIKVGNILEKQFGKDNVKTITDEYGNQWREIEIRPERESQPILLQEVIGSNEFNQERNEEIKQILQELYPEINLEYTNELDSRGQYQAGNILINALLQNTDTLPHEYAHHYIRMFLNSPIVQNGIKLFGSEEKLVQAIGENSIKALNWYNRLWNWIKGLFNSKQKELNKLTKSFLSRQNLGEMSKISDDILRQELTTEEETLTEDLSSMDDLTALKTKMIKALESKLERNIKFGHTNIKDIEKQEEFIARIKKLEVEKAIMLFAEQAKKTTDSVFDSWKKEYKPRLKDNKIGDVLTPGLLYIWKDYLATYDDIDSFIDYLISEDLLDMKKKEDKEVLAKLTYIRGKKNAIKSLYTRYGKPLLAEKLLPFYRKVYHDEEVKRKKEYKHLDEATKSKYTEKQWVEYQLHLEDINLRQKTITMLQNEMETASHDIGYMASMFVSPLETSDPLFAAMAEKLQFKEMERIIDRIIPTRNRLVDLVRKLEKIASGYSTLKELYGPILEKDEKGNYTGKHVDRFGSAFWNEYDRVQGELDSLRDKNDYLFDYGGHTYEIVTKDKVSTYTIDGETTFHGEDAESLYHKELEDYIKYKKRIWVRQNAPLRGTDFGKAKWEYIRQLRDEGIMSKEEVDNLDINEQEFKFDDYWDLKEMGLLNETAARLLSDWVFNNLWDYREPIDIWKNKNKSWYEFQRLSKDDPRRELFDLLLAIKDEANFLLPHRMRLRHGDLPNILATNEERIKDGKVLDTLKNTIARQFDVLVDDTTRGNYQLEDASGKKIHMVPIYFTGKTNKKNKDGEWIFDPNKQSYDLASIFYRFYDMATSYEVRNSLKSEAEMVGSFLETRTVTKVVNGKEQTKKTSRVSEQYKSWMEDVFYGVKDIALGQFDILGFKIDTAKFARFMAKYTGLNIMAGNIKAGVSNITMGELQQINESLVGQYLSKKSFSAGSNFYHKNLAGIVADIGSRKPKNIVTLLNEQFQITMESLDPRFKDSNKVKQLAKSSTLMFATRMGDHWMKNRFFLGMLHEKVAYDKDGNELGPMLEQYSTNKKGELELSDKVDLNKSKWTKEDQYRFTMKIQSILSGIHQEISPLGRAAAERNALLGLALLFRKFIAPGLLRRYRKGQYIERMGDDVEGYYRTTGRFLNNLRKELKTFKFAVLQEKWEDLTDLEKKNILRTVNDLIFLLMAVAFFMILTGGDDDDDNMWITDFTIYQLKRYRTELLFFTPKIDEAWSLLRSPAASMTLVENFMNTIYQLHDPGEVYERGQWKGHLKYEKIMWNYVPVMKSLYQMRDIKEQTEFLNRR